MDQFTPWYGLAMAIGFNMVNPTGGQFSEEPSFRGFAQSRLQSHRTPLAATAIMAVAVTGWHLPLIVMPAFDLHPIEALATAAVTFWYAWLFNHAAGSSLITLLAHATEGSVDTGAFWSAGTDAAARQPWLYTAVWSLVAVGLLIGHRRFWTRPAAPDRPHPPPPTPFGTETRSGSRRPEMPPRPNTEGASHDNPTPPAGALRRRRVAASDRGGLIVVGLFARTRR